MSRLAQFALAANDAGRIFQFISAGSLIPLLVCLIYHEYDALLPMAAAPASFFALGTIFRYVPRPKKEPGFGVTLASVALIWLFAALLSALPFYLILDMAFVDCFFEAMSGWTDTGMTMLVSVDDTPKTLLFWRSLMQWLGGLGIVAFTISLASRSGLIQKSLYRSEGRSEAFMPSVVATGFQMWKIYIVLTGIGVLMILLTGVGLWDAVNLSMCALATGGFTVHSAGISYYDNHALEFILIPLMIAGAIPFKIYYALYNGRSLRAFRNGPALLLFSFVGILGLILTSSLVYQNNFEIAEAFRQGMFMSSAAVTSTGYQITNPSLWHVSSILLISLVMISGGCLGSTAGGLKLDRVLIFGKGFVWMLKRLSVHSKVLVPFRQDRRVIPGQQVEFELSKQLFTIIGYLLMIQLAILVLLLFNSDQSLPGLIFDTASAFGNNGISTGFISPDSDIPTKLIYTMLMWLGRLELLPVLMLIIGIVKGFEYIPSE